MVETSFTFIEQYFNIGEQDLMQTNFCFFIDVNEDGEEILNAAAGSFSMHSNQCCWNYAEYIPWQHDIRFNSQFFELIDFIRKLMICFSTVLQIG